MQSIWEISLGTCLVLLGDYPPIPCFTDQMAGLKWEGFLRRTSSLVPGSLAGFMLLCGRGRPPWNAHGTRLSPAIPAPGIWLTDPPFHTWSGSCFPSRGLVMLSVPRAQSKTLLSKAPELLLPLPCWDAEGYNMRPSFRSNWYPEIKKCRLIFAAIWQEEQQFLGWKIFALNFTVT